MEAVLTNSSWMKNVKGITERKGEQIMVVQHNMQALNANRMLGITTSAQAKSTEKLSSGYKINRAADDAAGLSISEKMRKQIKGLDQASTNAQDGISAVQTAEGALTEVHSMLQRMNELAVQAANGTNSESDRQSIQDEIEQLTTEIDRVAETTKFNEAYLLKGNGKDTVVKINAKDAGIAGNMMGVGTGTATFTMDALKTGEQITIGSKGYTIGSTIKEVQDAVAKATTGDVVTINGTAYTVVNSGATNVSDNEYDLKDLQTLVSDSDKVVVGSHSYVAMVDDKDPNGIGDNDASIISLEKAYELISKELAKASSVGVDPGSDATVTNKYSYAAADTEWKFEIKEGEVATTQGLQFTLHVGADADESNKIALTIDAMDTTSLGVANINVVDNTGAKATYAIDSIADAIAKVSATRSELGAVQNRLEHTIANLDNVVENTTAAESEIRDTDMAEQMVDYSKNNILMQAGQSMLTQANQATQGVLSLLG